MVETDVLRVFAICYLLSKAPVARMLSIRADFVHQASFIRLCSFGLLSFGI
jgi:hypothetical protein